MTRRLSRAVRRLKSDRLLALAPAVPRHRTAGRPAAPALRALAGSLVLAAGCLPVAQAQEAAADVPPGASRDAQAVQAFDIPAGPLGGALARYAAASGALVAASAEQVEGRRSPGVQGRMNAQAALQALLAGTGLQAVAEAPGQFRLRAAPAAPVSAGDATLTQIKVTAAANADGTTEGSGSYTTRAMNTATRLNLAPRETPQSVTVVTREQLDDRAALSLTDAMRLTPGVSVSNADGPGRTSFTSRGFYIETIMYDGLPSRYEGWVVGTVANTAIMDRIEVVRGATGLVTGSGNPSGAINLVRKRPTAERRVALTGRVGSWDNQQFEFDAGGPINESGSLRGRIVAAYQDSEGFRDREAEEHGVLYAVAEADLGTRTTATLGLSYQDDYMNHFWGGLPISADGRHMDLPRRTNPSTSWDRKDQQLTTAFVDLDHHFENGWRARVAAIRSWQDATFAGTYISRYTTGTPGVIGSMGHSAYRGDYIERQTNLDAMLAGPFRLFGREHEFAAGGNRRTADKTTQSFSGSGIISRDLVFPDWDLASAPEPDWQPTTHSRNQVTDDGAFAVARFGLADSLKLIYGLRADWFSYDNRTGTGSYSVKRKISRYGGLILDLGARHSVYLGYADIFQPQTQRDAAGSMLGPKVGKNYEVGVKGEYLDGRLNASAAVFRIDEENRAIALRDQSLCPTYPDESCYETSGLVRGQGFETELQGALTPSWQLSAGYTYVDIRYKRDANPTNIGKRINADTPRHELKLSTMYRPSGEQPGWRVGGGLSVQSAIYGEVSLPDGRERRISQARYALVDLAGGYRINRNLDLQLNVRNVFDKVYYRGLGYDIGWGSTDTYGPPRSFMLSARYTY